MTALMAVIVIVVIVVIVAVVAVIGRYSGSHCGRKKGFLLAFAEGIVISVLPEPSVNKFSHKKFIRILIYRKNRLPLQ